MRQNLSGCVLAHPHVPSKTQSPAMSPPQSVELFEVWSKAVKEWSKGGQVAAAPCPTVDKRRSNGGLTRSNSGQIEARSPRRRLTRGAAQQHSPEPVARRGKGPWNAGSRPSRMPRGAGPAQGWIVGWGLPHACAAATAEAARAEVVSRACLGGECRGVGDAWRLNGGQKEVE
jgi:hypothetical protein